MQNMEKMSQPYCYRYQDPPVGRATREKAPDGSECCNNWKCRMIHQIIDKTHDDWKIACRNTELYQEIKEFREGERRKLNASDAAKASTE